MKYFKTLLVVAFSFMLVACAQDVTYESNGFEITMGEGFYEKDLVSATAYFESQEAIVTALKETYESLESVGITEESTIEDYANAVLTQNQASYDLKTDENLTYLTYESEVSGKDFFYLSTFYKSDEGFWLVSFACEEEDKEEYEPLFIKWAKTVNVD